MFIQFQWTQLMWASWNGHLEVVKLLLKFKAKINLQDSVSV